jgi:hypothetical protein
MEEVAMYDRFFVFTSFIIIAPLFSPNLVACLMQIHEVNLGANSTIANYRRFPAQFTGSKTTNV